MAETDDVVRDDLVLLKRRADGVAVITLNNPKVNALSSQMMAALSGVVEQLAADLPGAIVITGGERIFAAGADISEFKGPDEARMVASGIHRALDAIAALPRFVIAAVSGYALGGGCELALACDYRIASERAVFGQPEILLGIIPGGGGTQRLPRLVGASRALELIVTGRQVRAEEALHIGLANEIVPTDELMTRALALAAEVASGALAAHGRAKQAVNHGLELPLDHALALEIELFQDVFTTDDSQVGVASFLEQGPGKATFSGR